MRNHSLERESPAPGPRGAPIGDLLGSSVSSQNTDNHTPRQVAHGYVLAELRVAALRARLIVNEVDTVGLAFKAGFMSADMAIEHLLEIGAPLSLKFCPNQGEVW